MNQQNFEKNCNNWLYIYGLNNFKLDSCIFNINTGLADSNKSFSTGSCDIFHILYAYY